MKKIVFKNRFTLLLTVVFAYVAVLVTEGAITGRSPELLQFDNSLFELTIPDIEQFSEQFN